MEIILDSDILIALTKDKIEVDTSNSYYINSIVYAETLYGLLYIGKKVEDFDIFLEYHEIELLDIGKDTAKIFIELKLKLNTAGKRLPDNDLLIAASCLEYSLALSTNNNKHFKLIPKLNFCRP
jgi:tRNA(fMet)-specific endonuclease VapC